MIVKQYLPKFVDADRKRAEVNSMEELLDLDFIKNAIHVYSHEFPRCVIKHDYKECWILKCVSQDGDNGRVIAFIKDFAPDVTAITYKGISVEVRG